MHRDLFIILRNSDCCYVENAVWPSKLSWPSRRCYRHCNCSSGTGKMLTKLVRFHDNAATLRCAVDRPILIQSQAALPHWTCVTVLFNRWTKAYMLLRNYIYSLALYGLYRFVKGGSGNINDSVNINSQQPVRVLGCIFLHSFAQFFTSESARSLLTDGAAVVSVTASSRV